MASHVLLVSNPPHSRVDVQVAASVLDLLPVDANLKVRYGIPEIWLACEDEAEAGVARDQLAERGMRTTVTAGEALLRIKPQRLAQSLELTDDAVVVTAKGATVEIPNRDPLVIVSCTPRAAEGAPPNLRSFIAPNVQVFDTCPFVDLYLPNGMRVAIYGELVDFSVLGSQRTPSQTRNMVLIGQMLRARFTNSRFDDRLLNMQLRRRAGHGVPVNFRESRKGYSFASPGLDVLLGEIAPGLEMIWQTELCSRLAYLTSRAELGAPATGS